MGIGWGKVLVYYIISTPFRLVYYTREKISDYRRIEKHFFVVIDVLWGPRIKGMNRRRRVSILTSINGSR